MRKTNDKNPVAEETTKKPSKTNSKTKSTNTVSETKTKKTSTPRKSDSKKNTSTKSTTKKASTTDKKTTKKTKETTAKSVKKSASKKTSSEPKKSTTSKKTSSTQKTSTKKSTPKAKKDEKLDDEVIVTNMDINKMEEKLKALQKASEELKSRKEPKVESKLQNKKVITSDSQTSKSTTEKKHSETLKTKKDTESTLETPNTISSNTTTNSNTAKSSNQKKKKNVIYDFIILICLILIVYSSINIIIWQKNNIDNNKMIEKVTEETPISKIEEVSISDTLQIEKKGYDFSDLLTQNPDTVGWINVPNTQINYPVVKGTDNEFYLKHSFDKSYNSAGWIYADYRNQFDGTDQNLIIYGHNRLNNNMFGTLENTLTHEWQSLETNHYITLSTLENSQLYKIFSVFICTSEESENYLRTNFTNKEDYKNYIDNLKNLSNYDFNTTLNDNDQILTLYTCHGLNNERLLVCCKLIV